jgi:RNA polymerase sigma-70 factor (ECF subfamily)
VLLRIRDVMETAPGVSAPPCARGPASIFGLGTPRVTSGLVESGRARDPSPRAAPASAPDAAARAKGDAAMSRYAAGDDAAFGEVYDALAPRLFGYLVRQTREQARAEDIVQQTFLQMHRARGTFVPGAEVVPWAFAIARRLLIDSYRRGRREVLLSAPAGGEDAPADRDDPASPDAAADDLVQASQLAARIHAELARLPETQRVAFELLKEEGLSLAEAAQVLGTTVSAVKLRAHRAYEALRLVLGDVLGKDALGEEKVP